ncbi:hypothetical protein COU75_03120 [Candidatus Peregrinibacteria bacterium CG10_big_fil_rev_8_21_14_0_10_42_8]|nr:MAG: hypothetical protein COU75_03120 [Candidatus Peregrinibacteria bacterium CG10_big_fil_rev_8_21_14_0_10_42_8]
MGLEHLSSQGSPEAINVDKSGEKKPPSEASVESTKLREVYSSYINNEKRAANTSVDNIENRFSSVGTSLGYVSCLENILTEMKDSDEWFGDSADETAKEKRILQNAASAVSSNLDAMAIVLEQMSPESREYEKLRLLYVDRRSRLTELVSSADEEMENVELRSATMAVEQAQKTMTHMTLEEAVDWTKQVLAMIDMNDWQSKGLAETFGVLTNTLQQSLSGKIAQEKTLLVQDPTKAPDFYRHAMDLAKLFSGRGSPIDSNLTNIDFAVSMAKDALGFEELTLQYMEQTLQKQNPLKEYIDEKRDYVLQQLENSPGLHEHPAVQEMESTIKSTPHSLQAIIQQYTIIRNLEHMFMGGEGYPNVGEEINEKLMPQLEVAMEKFETFLDGDYLTGAATLEEINTSVGGKGLSKQQIESWQLLADIQGYGYDVGDKTWSYVGAGAKIAAMVAAGIAVGVATGGLGLVAGSLAGGAAMTVTNAAMNQQGFDSLGDAASVYGKDMTVNTLTMGTARYLTAGRAAYQLSRSGMLAEAGGTRELFKIATKKGGLRLVNSFDDAAHIGTRLTGATLEGSADVIIGTTLDTAITGGEFLDNLKSNALFMGLGYADLSSASLRALRGLPAEDLHGIAQVVQSATLKRTNLHELCRGADIDPMALMQAVDPRAMLGALSKADADAILKNVASLQELKDVFKTSLQSLSVEQILQQKGTLEPGTSLSKDQHNAIEEAHLVGEGEMGKDGTPACKGNYTVEQLHRKAVILDKAGISKDQRRVLMEAGIVGILPSPSPPHKPPSKNNPSGVTIPKGAPPITPPLRPTLKNIPEAKTSFQDFSLLDQFSDRSYTEVRKDLSGMEYHDLFSQKDAYNKRVTAIETDYQKKFGEKKMPYSTDAEAVTFFKNFTKDPSLHGKDGGFHNGGAVLDYGNGLNTLDSNHPHTVFYINPQLAEIPHVARSLDNMLKNQNAQIKIYTDSIGPEVTNPSVRSSNKLCVYFDGKDHEGISRFLKDFHENADDLLPKMKPANFDDLLYHFHIPVAPGISFIERSNGRSWDSNYLNYFSSPGESMNTGQPAQIRSWSERGVIPGIRGWNAVTALQGAAQRTRIQNMIGLRKDE